MFAIKHYLKIRVAKYFPSLGKESLFSNCQHTCDLGWQIWDRILQAPERSMTDTVSFGFHLPRYDKLYFENNHCDSTLLLSLQHDMT